MRRRSLTFVLAFVTGASVALFACVGDDPAASMTILGPDAATPDGNAPPPATGDASPTDSGGGGTADNTAPPVDSSSNTDAGDGGCAAPKVMCGTACIDTSASESNCGSCGRACTGAFSCADGRCGNDIVDVAMGDGHSCVALASGNVWCWGTNFRGQLGVERSVASSAVPMQADITDVVRVTAGFDMTCAVKKDQSVWCWGYNAGGALGHPSGGGNPVDDSDCTGSCNATPQKVADLALADEVLLGGVVGCARTVAGRVQCWGTASCGNLGTPDAGSSVIGLPTVVANVANVKHLPTSSGLAKHACVIKDDGSVVCWGDNGSGECGHTPEPEPPTCQIFGGISPPTAVAGIANAVSVAVGFNNITCAVANGGKVSCWGSNLGGLITPPTTDSSAHYVPVPINLGALKATKVVLGDAHACALMEDHTVRCWGLNANGQLGDGNAAGGSTIFTPQTVKAVTANDLWSGRNFAGATLTSGSLAMWGANGSGQLAQPAAPSKPTPTAVLGLP